MKHAFAVSAFAIAVAVLVALWVLVPRESGSAVVGGTPTYGIETSQGAAWTSQSHEKTLRLRLESGWFELSVDKLRAGQRFIVDLPDGELEVKGTRFVVEVHDAKTARVRVFEGRVALRFRGQPSSLLEAGDTWPVIAAARMDEAPTPPVKPPARASAARSRVPEAAPTLPAHASGERPAPASDPKTPGGDGFAQAMSAFNAGDFGKAEQLLTAFEHAHPADARVEDATFLRAVARQRRGDVVRARTIARDYLRRYPNGLRRAEAERLLR